MASFAFGLNMFSAQRIFRVAVVIESGVLPVFFDMTGFAFVAEPAFVTLAVVVGFMTGDTSGF